LILGSENCGCHHWLAQQWYSKPLHKPLHRMSPSLLIPLAYFATILETWLSLHWHSPIASMNLLVLIPFVWLIACGGPYGFVTTALIGLICDLNHSAPLGIEMAIYTIVGYTVLCLRRQFNAERQPAQLALFALAAIATTTAEAIVALCLYERHISFSAMLQQIASISLFTILMAVPILSAIHWQRNYRNPIRFVTTPPVR
jgi:rod shape-determining protein MreD